MKNFTMIMMVAMLSVGSVFAQSADFMVKVWDSSIGWDSNVFGAVILLEEVDNSSNTHSVTVEDGGFATPSTIFWGVPYGSYNVTVTADGYKPYTSVLAVNENVGNDNVFYLEPLATNIHETKIPSISVYPNPTTGLVNISTEVEKVEVYNVSGSLVKVVNGPALTGFDISNLSNGLYVLKVTDSNNETALIKINKK
ncbi:T9SS type A sorting domain-containing protein [Saccharicrinis aurantiacus]|uniref:T9SS type A sorting domain-containing protein n=1 Tax=Saccharicrinis aurantiacus TaxID=1849719 RepID=UPI00249096E5|nr:T9SS type A sorting domain-containing protein [Saccharicrinis aurantiacus]